MTAGTGTQGRMEGHASELDRRFAFRHVFAVNRVLTAERGLDGGFADGRALASGSGTGDGSGLTLPPAGYLTMVDFCRVAVCFSVVFQHSFLWADMSGNVTGTALVTMLHFTRDAFFVVSGLVVCYAEITRPRSTWGFWKRRYVQLGVPFVAWTCIYVVYTMLTSNVGWSQVGTVLWYDLRYGFYQLYVVIVLFQFYLIFPFLLLLLRATKRHVLILSISAAIALVIGVDLHYDPHWGVVGHDIHVIGTVWPWGRDLLSYQLYFIAGAIVAFHLEQIFAFLRKWYRWVLAASAAVGVATLSWYLSDIWGGAGTAKASDVFQPIAVIWGLSATAGIFTLSWMWWWRRAAGVGGVGGVGGAAGVAGVGSPDGAGRPTRWFSITRLAELTGGIFLSHVLFIELIRSALYSNFVGGAHLPWPVTVLVFYVGTLSAAVAFVSVIVRTPLRWVLGGPVRAEQRRRIDAVSAVRASRLEGGNALPGGGAVRGGAKQVAVNR